MSSLTRSEYRHEEQRRVTESPFKETKWDRHLDTLLTDLNDTVGSPGGQQRAMVPAAPPSGPGVVTDSRGVAGSGDFHERREFTSPDQRTRVVQERYEHTARGDTGKPSVTRYYETKPGDHHPSLQTTSSDRHQSFQTTSSRTTSQSDSARHTTKPEEPMPAAQYHTTQTVTEYHQKKPQTTVYYDQSPLLEGKTQSHYQTVKTISEPVSKRPEYIEYFEEIPVASSTPKLQHHTTKTVTERREQAPAATHQYYETAPTAGRRTTKTVTEYRHQGQEPPPASPHYITNTSTEVVDRATTPATTQYIDGKPMTIRYVDKKPITIYHDAKQRYEQEPPPPPPPPAEPKPATVYFERIIERQPIIHVYGSSDTSQHSTQYDTAHQHSTQFDTAHQYNTQPTSERTYSTVTEHTQRPVSVPIPDPVYSRPAAHQRPPRARSPDATVTNQAVTKQVYKSSYAGGQHAPQDQVASQPGGDGSRFKQNILDLDTLLDDLDHARKKPASNGVSTTTTTYDGPAGTSTPYRHTNIQKTTKTSKYTTSSGDPIPSQPTPGDQLTTLGLTGPRHSPSPNPLDGLDRNLAPELSEPPQAGTTRITKYEYRSSNRRDVSPQPAAPALGPALGPPLARTLPPADSTRTSTDRREYSSSTSNTMERQPPPPQQPDVTDKTVSYNVYNTEQTLAGVPPPPVVPGQPGSNTTINYHIYNYGTLGPDGQPVGSPPPSEAGGPPRGGTLPRHHDTNTSTSTTTTAYRYDQPPTQQPHPLPAQPLTKSPPPGADTTISNSYVYEKHASTQPPPQPHHQKPAPTPPPPGSQPTGPNTSYTTSTVTKHYTIGPDGTEVPVRAGSPPYDQQYPRFPVEEPPQGHHTRTTTTTIERSQTHGTPFPARSPSPSTLGRRPQDDGPRAPFPGAPRRPVDDIDTPRRVDELMAQIPDTPQDGTYPYGPRRRELNGRSSTTHFTVTESEPLVQGHTQVTLDAKSGAVVPHAPTKPVSGPPVYYPPGSTEFKPKPESEMMFQSYESRGGGKYKSGYKASGKYKAKGGSKESHSEGGAVIPICLPLCCGAACSVM